MANKLKRQAVDPNDFREVLTANRTYYVRTDGNDNNTGLTNTSGGAFLTIQKAVDTIASLDINAKTVTIQIADGTYTGSIRLKSVIGVSDVDQLIIQGNSGTPANVHINTTGDAITSIGVGPAWTVKNLKITSTGFCIFANNQSIIRFSNLIFGTGGYAHLGSTSSASIVATGNYSISGSATHHVYSDLGGSVSTGSRTVTFLASVTFTRYAYTLIGGVFTANAMTFTYGAFSVTGARYYIEANGVIYTGGGGGSYLPGNAAGTTSTGGQYV